MDNAPLAPPGTAPSPPTPPGTAPSPPIVNLGELPARRAILVCTIVFPVLAAVFVGLRFYSRYLRKLPWLADDWTILGSLVLAMVSCFLTFDATLNHSLGIIDPRLTPSELQLGFKYLYAILLLISITYGLIKISVVLFFRRIFSIKWFRIASDVAIGILICWTIVLIIVYALNSWNLPMFWNMRLLDYPVFNLVMAVLDVVFDVGILMMPLPVIKTLKIDRTRKYSIVGIFWLSGFCIVASAMRIYYSDLQVRQQPTWSLAEISTIQLSNSLWLAIETCSSIVAACLPTLGALLKAKNASSSRSSGYLPSAKSSPLGPHSAEWSGGRFVGKDAGSGSEYSAYAATTQAPAADKIFGRTDHRVSYPHRAIRMERTFEAQYDPV